MLEGFFKDFRQFSAMAYALFKKTFNHKLHSKDITFNLVQVLQWDGCSSLNLFPFLYLRPNLKFLLNDIFYDIPVASSLSSDGSFNQRRDNL